jgi:uncharacterized membrane protein
MWLRFLVYGLLGWGAEIVWTALPKRWPFDPALEGFTTLWAFPLYGSAVFLFEPLHDWLRPWPLLARGLVYAAGFIVVELVAHFLIARLVGKKPWDYTGQTRWTIGGYTRLDYAPLWFLAGILLEPVHDTLVRAAPALSAAFGGKM